MNDASGTESPAQAAARPASPPLKDRNDNRLLALRTEQIKLLYDSAPAAFAATVMCSAALVIVEWAVVPPAPLLAWLAYMLALTTSRFILARAFQRAAPGQQETSRWETRFLIGTLLAGLGWGSAAFLLFPESSAPHQIFLIFILGGMTAGAVSTLSAKFSAFLCFALPTMAPAAIRLLSEDSTPLASTMGWLLVVFTLALAYVTSRVHATIVRSLELRLQNTALLDQLRMQTVQLEQAELARAASDRRYQFFVDQATDIIYRTDPAGQFTFVNAAAARIMHYAEAEMIGRRFTEFIRPDYRQAAEQFYSRQLVCKISSTYFEFPARAKDGRDVWLGQNVQLLTEGERVVGFQAVVRDITDRKQAEDRLKATTHQLETLIQASPLAIMSLDTEGDTVVRWNRAAEQIFGWREEEVLGRPLPNVPPGLEDESDTLWNQAVREGFLRGIELQRLRKDGALIDIALWVTIVKDAQGRVTDTFGIVEDITDRKRVEEALHLSERALRRALREREQLARNLHDNIIQSIYAIGFTLEECQRLAQEVPADDNRKLDQVIAALNRVIREVRGYIVAPVEESETLSSDELMASLQRLGGLMENSNSMRFSLTLDPAAAGTLTADQRAQLLYVAQEAMSNSLRHSGASTARVSLACIPHGVSFEILDNGVGFALPRIRNGNGGLKNIRLRARKIGANLDITSQPMGGTVISMEIPTNGHYDNARKV
ncbi:MAG: putative Hybrid sensor histidine kinase [Acidobacteria bacterium]|nr:putative Hybrid sensor histidine kinase [Acidobacteriota bacterium]